jgi:hypothetical protein
VIYKVAYVKNTKTEALGKTVHLSNGLETTYCGKTISDRWYNLGCGHLGEKPLVTCRACLRRLS